jgi:Na+/melibiose symporter-like transporter
LSVLFGLLYFVQGIVEPTEGLLSQPIKSLLRNWGYPAASAAWFIAILSLAWSIKPLYGLLTDFVPLAGTRRRGYLLLTTAVAAVSIATAYVLPLDASSFTLLLLVLLPSSVAIAFSDVVIDAMMIEAGQRTASTGRFQSIQWSCMYAATIATGVIGGWLSQWGLQQTGFLIAGLSCAVSLIAVWMLVREKPRAGGPSKLSAPLVLGEMKKTVRQPGLLAIGAFLFLWNFNPFSATVLYFYSIQSLQFSEQFVGALTSWHAAGLLGGSIFYGLVCRRISLPWLIHGSIVTGILATLAYWLYVDATSGIAVSIIAGVVYAAGTLGQLDLAARICRPETAGTTFALLMSLTNLSAALSQGVGGSMYDGLVEHRGHAFAFQALVAAGALSTAACWLLMPFISRARLAVVPSDR